MLIILTHIIYIVLVLEINSKPTSFRIDKQSNRSHIKRKARQLGYVS